MFTPVETTIGALLIQFATTSYLMTTGKTIGFSSVLSGFFKAPNVHNVSITAGLVSSAVFAMKMGLSLPVFPLSFGLATYVVAGFLVGIGTKLASGCTSGHMVNGLSRLRIRSLISVMIFVPTAMVTTYILNSTDFNCGIVPCYQTVLPSELTRLFLTNISYVLMPLNYIVSPLIAKWWGQLKIVALLNSFISGFTFGLGLIISGMSDPAKTIAFLNILTPSNFDPSLMLILLFLVIPNMIIWRFMVLNKPGPLNGSGQFDLAMSTETPPKFLLGSAIFGVGWGILGICPGPGILGMVFNTPLFSAAWVGSFILGNIAGGYV